MSRSGPNPPKVCTLPPVQPGTATLRIGRVEITLPIAPGEDVEATTARLLERMKQVQKAVEMDRTKPEVQVPRRLRQLVLFPRGEDG